MKNIEKVLYVAPRFHTNQVFPVKSLIRNGVIVEFFSHYTHKTENYEDIKPDVIGDNYLFKILLKILYKMDDTKKAYFQRKWGFPPIWKTYIKIKKFQPDLIILRDRTLYTLAFIFMAKMLRLKFIIYTQTPKYTIRKSKLREKIKYMFFGKYEFTPILGEKNSDLKYFNEENIFFVPLIIDENKSIQDNQKKLLNSNSLKFLMVSEFVERKKILETIYIVNDLIKSGYNLQLTIIGNAKKDQAQKYFTKAMKLVHDHNLEKNVILKTDVPHKEVLKEYLKSNVLLFPATKEAAGISLLEAMASGLTIICSTGNGLKEYLTHEKGGYIFLDNKMEDFHFYIKKLLDNPDLIQKFGENNLEKIRIQYSAENYYKRINEIWKLI